MAIDLNKPSDAMDRIHGDLPLDLVLLNGLRFVAEGGRGDLFSSIPESIWTSLHERRG